VTNAADVPIALLNARRMTGKQEMTVMGKQGHNIWCGLEHGEEDLDWVVVPISAEKGLGVVAKRSLPSGYRIMVEKGLTSPSSHPAIADLEP